MPSSTLPSSCCKQQAPLPCFPLVAYHTVTLPPVPVISYCRTGAAATTGLCQYKILGLFLLSFRRPPRSAVSARARAPCRSAGPSRGTVASGAHVGPGSHELIVCGTHCALRLVDALPELCHHRAPRSRRPRPVCSDVSLRGERLPQTCDVSTQCAWFSCMRHSQHPGLAIEPTVKSYGHTNGILKPTPWYSSVSAGERECRLL